MQNKYKNLTLISPYSQMDIMPSILDALSFEFPENNFRKSFLSELNGSDQRFHSLILIQPFSKFYINIIKNNLKYQYNLLDKNIILYNLKTDPQEKNPQIIQNTPENSFSLIKKLLKI